MKSRRRKQCCHALQYGLNAAESLIRAKAAALAMTMIARGISVSSLSVLLMEN